MTVLAAGAISITEGAIVIPAETVARRLGLKVEALQLWPVATQYTIHQITVALERLMEEDAEAGRPFITALVLSKARAGLPAVGFFDCAQRLGRFIGDPNGVEARSFHATELNAALSYWGGCDANSIDAAAWPGDARAQSEGLTLMGWQNGIARTGNQFALT